MSSGVEYLLRARDMLSGTLQNAARQAQAMQGSVNNINRSFDQAGKASGKFSATASSGTSQISGKIQRLNDHLIDLKNRQIRAFDDKSIARYNSYIRKTQVELRRLNNLPPASFMQRMRSLPGRLGMIGAGFGIAFAVQKVFQFGKSIVTATADVEKYKLTLENMLGSKDAADARMKEYLKIAAKTPFEINDVVELGNGLQALGRYSKSNVMMLGDLAAAADKPLDQVRGAYAKLASGQKGIAVDMFRDLLITTDDWVKATGKGVSKSGELMATTEEMLAALPRIMNAKNFEGMMDKLAEGIWGRLSNIKDTLYLFIVGLGERLKPLIDAAITLLSKASDGLVGLLDFLDDNKETLIAITTGIGAAITVWGAYRTALFLTSATTYSTIIPAIKAIGIAIYNIPMLGWIFAIIGALIALGTYFYRTSETFRGVLMGMGEAAMVIFGELGEFMLEVLGGVWDLIKAVFNPANWFDGQDQTGAALDRIKNAASKYGKAISQGYEAGKKAGVATFKKEKTEEAEENNPEEVNAKNGNEVNESLQSITSGGAKQTHININLNKEMVGQITINPTTMQEGVSDIKNMIMETLAQVLNGANRIALD